MNATLLDAIEMAQLADADQEVLVDGDQKAIIWWVVHPDGSKSVLRILPW